MPGTHSVPRTTPRSRLANANNNTIPKASAGATGPLARVASARNAYAVASQAELPCEEIALAGSADSGWGPRAQQYQASKAMVKVAASGISVEAARAKPTHAPEEAVTSAASIATAGAQRRMKA